MSNGYEEIDLHRMTSAEALAAFVRVFNQCVAAGNIPLRVIHGYGSTGGEGVIGNKIRQLLARNRNAADWMPGEDVFCNPGMTLVYPKNRLPTGGRH